LIFVVVAGVVQLVLAAALEVVEAAEVAGNPGGFFVVVAG